MVLRFIQTIILIIPSPIGTIKVKLQKNHPVFITKQGAFLHWKLKESWALKRNEEQCIIHFGENSLSNCISMYFTNMANSKFTKKEKGSWTITVLTFLWCFPFTVLVVDMGECSHSLQIFIHMLTWEEKTEYDRQRTSYYRSWSARSAVLVPDVMPWNDLHLVAPSHLFQYIFEEQRRHI